LGPLEALDHLLNFLLPAFALGSLAAAMTKLIWRRELVGVGWRRLAGWASVAAAATLFAGLVAFGRDGTMATYGAMLLATALALWWAGFRR
jgi:hypothetical protein